MKKLKIKEILPTKYWGVLRRLSFDLNRRPTVRLDNIKAESKFPNKESGGLIISADFEMAWAWRYSKSGADPYHKGRIERENIPVLVKLLEDYNIPITFATVGHLFLESCKHEDHDWMQRPPHFDDHWRFLSGDWFEHDPNSSVDENPEWYAPDLIKMILDSSVNHEIGTHTFSHIDCTEKNCPPDVLVDELKACASEAEKLGINLISMVYPGGTLGNYEVLKKMGIKIYRKSERFELSYPYRDSVGLLITTSSAQMEFDPKLGWSDQYFANRLKKYIQKAISTRTVAHLWFHPSLHPFLLAKVFPQVLEYACRQRDFGNLWIGTMGQMATHIEMNKIL